MLRLVLGFLVVVYGSCPLTIQRSYGNRIIRCNPVFNCGPDYEARVCTEDEGSDQCVKCNDGYIQPEIVSSLNDTDFPCFRPNSNHDLCPIDTTESLYVSPLLYCPYFCRCRYEGCYHGKDPCLCSRRTGSPCPQGQTMEKYTGDCVPCPANTYKLDVGCGPCTINETAWRLDRLSSDNCTEIAHTIPTTTSKPTTMPLKTQTTRENTQSTFTPLTSEVTNDVNKSHDSSSTAPSSTGLIVGVSVGVVCLVVIVIFVTYNIRRRGNSPPLQQLFTRKNTQTHTIITEDSPSREEAVPLR